jgi:hypothetical protein
MSAAAPACRNCALPLAPAQRFCGSCGQRVIEGRLTMREIAHDFMHALLHVDHSIFSLIRALLTRPGHVARDYVDGRRKRYFGPFAFLVISVGVTSAIILVMGVQWFRPITDSAAAGLLQRHMNVVSLLQIPLLAAACAWLFAGQKMYFGEHLVLAAYSSGMRVLFLGLIETPLIALFSLDSANPWLAATYTSLWSAYFAVAALQFYRGNRAWTACKAIVAALLSQTLIIGVVFVFIVVFAWIRH